MGAAGKGVCVYVFVWGGGLCGCGMGEIRVKWSFYSFRLLLGILSQFYSLKVHDIILQCLNFCV